MTAEAGVLVALGALLDLLKEHRPIECGDVLAHKDGTRPMLESSLGVIDQCQGGGIDAAVWSCTCGWSRSVPLRLNR